MSETRIDSTPPGFGRGGRGALFATRYATGDTVYTIQYDSLLVRTTGGRGQWAYGVYALDSAGRGFGGRGRGVFGARYPGSAPGTYSAGWVGPAAGNANRAQGLEIPLQAKSGIRGLESSSVESADTYFFAPGELARSALRVMVVHLTPGASWRGPF